MTRQKRVIKEFGDIIVRTRGSCDNVDFTTRPHTSNTGIMQFNETGLLRYVHTSYTSSVLLFHSFHRSFFLFPHPSLPTRLTAIGLRWTGNCSQFALLAVLPLRKQRSRETTDVYRRSQDSAALEKAAPKRDRSKTHPRREPQFSLSTWEKKRLDEATTTRCVSL